MNETPDSRRIITVVAIIVAVGLLLSLLAGALAGGVAGYFVGRQQGRIAAEHAVDEKAPLGRVPLPFEEEPLPQMPEKKDLPGQQPTWEELVPPHLHGLELEGAVVVQVVEDTPAAEAGLQPGDIIVSVDGSSVAEVEDLRELLEGYKPGDRVELGLWDQKEERTVQVTLSEHPDDPDRAYLGIYYEMLRMNQEPEGSRD